MIKVNEQPTSGQFVAMWMFGGELWSDTFKWKGDRLWIGKEDHDNKIIWKGTTFPNEGYSHEVSKSVEYYIAEG